MSTTKNFLNERSNSLPLGPLIEANFTAEQKAANKSRIFTAILFAFIVAFLLIILLTGMRVYSLINNERVASDTSRLGLSLIANSVRMNDTTGAVGVGSGPEGPSLVLTEFTESGSYETRIYTYNGKIVEEYSLASNAYTPEKAREIVASETFSFEYSDGLLTIHTDQGNTCVSLHSQGGGA